MREVPARVGSPRAGNGATRLSEVQEPVLEPAEASGEEGRASGASVGPLLFSETTAQERNGRSE
jgi:hypothetical protein